jgi:hypothetical protein
MTRMVKLEVISITNNRKRRKKFKMEEAMRMTVRKDLDVLLVKSNDTTGVLWRLAKSLMGQRAPSISTSN